ncbi:MAG: ribosome silencing factor [Nitrospirota bacterium]
MNSLVTYSYGRGEPLIDSKEKAKKAAKAALSKKAKDTVILELKDLSTIADYFIICSGESSTQIRTIAETIKEKFSKYKMLLLGIEGLNFARWVLMDYGDVVIHIFSKESRDYYELEKLWLDAPRISIDKSMHNPVHTKEKKKSK